MSLFNTRHFCDMENLVGNIVTLLLLCEMSLTLKVNNPCLLTIHGNIQRYIKDGDLILGGLFQFFHFLYHGPYLLRVPISKMCSMPSPRFLRHFLAFDFAVSEINRNADILPNVTLGYDIFDSCFFEDTAVEGTLRILSGGVKMNPNYDCHGYGKVVAFIGHLLSSSSQAIASLLRVYGYPQISYGATDPIFHDRAQFPFFFRTVTNNHVQNEAVAKLLKEFRWSWVGIVYSDDDSNHKASEDLRGSIIRSGGCVAYSVKISTLENANNCVEAANVIRSSSANVIVAHSHLDQLMILIAHIDDPEFISGKVWILFCYPEIQLYSYRKRDILVLNGSVIVTSYKGDIPGLKDFLYRVTPETYPNRLLKELWKEAFHCTYKTIMTHLPRNLHICETNLSLRSVPVSEYDVDNFRVTYSVYTAVYAVAHALHYMFTSRSQDKIISATPGQLTRYVKRVHFRTTSGDEIFFDEKGDPPERIDLLNWLIFPNDTVKRTQVGQYHSQQLFLNKSTVIWGNLSEMTPRSVCSEDCIPGYRKSLVKGKPVCCFVCAPCSEGEITNTTDTETCIICPEEEWPNEKKDRCVKRVTLFLNIQDPLGTLLLASTGVFFIMTTVVLAIFIKHRDTPIVRANNIHVSFILIISLMFSFLCVLLFIGRPTVLSCLLRQVVFCLIFTLAISSTLAKTIIVLVAFTSTKPGGISKNWMGSSLSRLIIFICCLGQVLICSVWLLQSPPFPDKDTRSEVGKIILQCNEGSTTAFYAALGYMGFLAVSSFILAFLVRKLPDRFNEAHYITFSMLVFCSVWVTFIPVYLRTKGKYTVAVEVFAILASSAGLLFCLFIPKCFTIIIRPERNSRESVSDRKLH